MCVCVCVCVDKCDISLHVITFYDQFFLIVVRDSSVGIATRYVLGGPVFESQLEARFSDPVQTDPDVHPSSSTMGTRSLFRGRAAGSCR